LAFFVGFPMFYRCINNKEDNTTSDADH
jgi:hypothetical protein